MHADRAQQMAWLLVSTSYEGLFRLHIHQGSMEVLRPSSILAKDETVQSTLALFLGHILQAVQSTALQEEVLDSLR